MPQRYFLKAKLSLSSSASPLANSIAPSNRTLQYPDEIDPSLWKKAVQQDGSHPDSRGASDGFRKKETMLQPTRSFQLPMAP